MSEPIVGCRARMTVRGRDGVIEEVVAVESVDVVCVPPLWNTILDAYLAEVCARWGLPAHLAGEAEPEADPPHVVEEKP